MLTNPLFLIGLVAVGIPIAIHLLQLRRYRKVYFSNTDLLEELQSEDRKQRNIRQLLILAARILAIVFLVLAFCQPVACDRGSQLNAGAMVVSVYVDNSYSMECGGMEGSLMESARQKAREIAAAYKPGDQFQLITNDMSGSQFHWLSREDFLDAVDAVQTSAVTQNLSSVASRQYDFLKSSSASNRHAYIVSDFQRSTADMAEFPSDSSVLTTLIPLGGSEVANIYIDSLSFDSPAFYPGATVQAEAFVRNDGDKAVEKLPLRLYAGGRQRAVASVDVPARGVVSVKLTFTLGDEGALQGYVETVDYPITFDDRLYFSLPVMRHIPMLVVSGMEENPFLKRLYQDDSLVTYRQVSVGQIDYSRLSDHHFIILDELHSIPSGLADMLHQFVVDGGSLLVVPGRGIESDSYNQLLASMQAPQLGAWVERATRAQSVEAGSSLFRGVFQGSREDMEMPAVLAHYRMSASGSTVGQEVVRLLDGDIYLTAIPAGGGVCYLFASPLRPDYTDFVRQALFVPTLYNMALFSSPVPQPYHTLTGTEPIPLQGIYDVENLPHLMLFDQKGEKIETDLIPDIRRMGSRQCLLPHGELTRAGNYRLQEYDSHLPSSDGEGGMLEGLSFNYSRSESDLACYSRGELEKTVEGMRLKNCSVAPGAQKSMTDYIRQRSQGKPLWRVCLLLVLAALLAETLLLKWGVSASDKRIGVRW